MKGLSCTKVIRTMYMSTVAVASPSLPSTLMYICTSSCSQNAAMLLTISDANKPFCHAHTCPYPYRISASPYLVNGTNFQAQNFILFFLQLLGGKMTKSRHHHMTMFRSGCLSLTYIFNTLKNVPSLPSIFCFMAK